MSQHWSRSTSVAGVGGARGGDAHDVTARVLEQDDRLPLTVPVPSDVNVAVVVSFDEMSVMFDRLENLLAYESSPGSPPRPPEQRGTAAEAPSAV